MQMQIQHQLRRVAAALLTAAVAVGTGAFSGLALETDSGTLESLQAFLLGKENAGGTDCNGDGVVDGMDLALLRQQQFDGEKYRTAMPALSAPTANCWSMKTASSISSKAWQSAIMCGRIPPQPLPRITMRQAIRNWRTWALTPCGSI